MARTTIESNIWQLGVEWARREKKRTLRKNDPWGSIGNAIAEKLAQTMRDKAKKRSR